MRSARLGHFWVSVGSGGRGTAKWTNNPHDEIVQDELLHPTRATLTKIDYEKRSAISLSNLALTHLERARPHLDDKQYRELAEYLNRGRAVAELFRRHSRAAFAALGALGMARGEYGTSEKARRLLNIGRQNARRLREQWKRAQQQYGGYLEHETSVEAVADQIDRKLAEAREFLREAE